MAQTMVDRGDVFSDRTPGFCLLDLAAPGVVSARHRHRPHSGLDAPRRSLGFASALRDPWPVKHLVGIGGMISGPRFRARNIEAFPHPFDMTTSCPHPVDMTASCSRPVDIMGRAWGEHCFHILAPRAWRRLGGRLVLRKYA